MIITSITPLPYPPYRVTNMKHINEMVSISDINHNKYVHPCEQLRNAHALGLKDVISRHFFAQAYYLMQGNSVPYGIVEVEYEYI